MKVDDSPRQGLLVFVRTAPNQIEAHCQRVFKPRGLLLWDVGRLSLDLLLIGNDLQLMCSFGPLPARWFTTADSFDAIAKSVADGKEPPAWGDWSAVLPGVLVRLRFDGPAPNAQAVMWGEYV